MQKVCLEDRSNVIVTLHLQISIRTTFLSREIPFLSREILSLFLFKMRRRLNADQGLSIKGHLQFLCQPEGDHCSKGRVGLSEKLTVHM